MVPVLARAAVAAGVSGIFMETHPNPSIAKSDGLNSMPMNQISALLKTLKEIDKITKTNGFIEDSLNDYNCNKRFEWANGASFNRGC